jgi:LacI family transcriptional regulator
MTTRQTLGVLVPANIDLARNILIGIRNYCNRKQDVRLILLSTSGFHRSLEQLRLELDALIAFESVPDHIKLLRNLCPRLVLTSNRCQNDHPKVINDDREIGRMGARDLLSKGCPVLAFLHAPDLFFAEERLQGAREIAASAGKELHVIDLSQQTHVPGALKTLNRLPAPVGILGCSDLHTRWLVEGMETPAKEIPTRFMLLGVDDDSLEQALCPVPLSSIALAGRQIGYTAARTAISWSDGTPPPGNPVLIRPQGIVTRQSTDHLAYTDPLVKKTVALINEKTAQFQEVSDLVDAIGIPRRTLEYRINKVTNESLGTLLTRARIQKASGLLTRTDLSVKEISYLVGLSEPRMLSLVFKRETGETPSEFRARTR